MTQEIKDFKQTLINGKISLIMTSCSKNGLKRTFWVIYESENKFKSIPIEIATKVSESKLTSKGITIKGTGMDMGLALWLRIATILNCKSEANENYSKNSFMFNRTYESFEMFIYNHPKLQKMFDFKFC